MRTRASALTAGLALLTSLIGVVPAQAAVIVSDWKVVSTGDLHTCGIRSTGILYCWGHNGAGRTGNGNASGNELSPDRITAVSDWKSVSAGSNHTCGIRGTGALYCWGANPFGQLGDGMSGTERLTPKRITTVSDWKSVSAGSNHTCGIRGTGALYCWGHNGSGQTGDGTSGNTRLSPTRITAVSDWRTVSAGNGHTCGIRGTGALYCWGLNHHGQIGDSTIGTSRLTPRRITAVSDWRTIDAGSSHTCGVRGTGALYCWGYNHQGQVGDGTNGIDRLTPRRITAVSDWRAVAAGGFHTCATRGTGALYCWGDNFSGQVGDGTTGVIRTTPKRITAVSDWKRVSTDTSTSCGIRGAGALYCWGHNGFGQIGDGTVGTNRMTPTRI